MPLPLQLSYIASGGAVEFSTGDPTPHPAQSYSLDLCCLVSIATPPASFRRASHWQTKLRTPLTCSLNNGCSDWKKQGVGRERGAFPGSPDSRRKSLAWHQQGALVLSLLAQQRQPGIWCLQFFSDKRYVSIAGEKLGESQLADHSLLPAPSGRIISLYADEFLTVSSIWLL